MNSEDFEVPELNIGNVCGGAVPERFEREVLEVLRNIKDLDTDPEATRSLTLVFKFNASKDRSYVAVEFSINHKDAPVETLAGGLFLRGDRSNVRAYVEDPRQLKIFAGEKSATDSKQ